MRPGTATSDGWRNPQAFAGTPNNTREPAPRKNPNRERLRFRYWWSRRESNPRPQALHSRTYVRSRVYCSRRALPDGQGKRAASPVAIRKSHPGPVCLTS